MPNPKSFRVRPLGRFGHTYLLHGLRYEAYRAVRLIILLMIIGFPAFVAYGHQLASALHVSDAALCLLAVMAALVAFLVLVRIADGGAKQQDDAPAEVDVADAAPLVRPTGFYGWYTVINRTVVLIAAAILAAFCSVTIIGAVAFGIHVPGSAIFLLLLSALGLVVAWPSPRR